MLCLVTEALVTLLVFSVTCAVSAHSMDNFFLGNEPIENANDSPLESSTNVLMIVFINECSGLTVSDRTKAVLKAFPCLSDRRILPGPHVTGVWFDSTSKTCFDDNADIFNSADACIRGISYDTVGDVEGCSPSHSKVTWSVDTLDGVVDDEFTFYSHTDDQTGQSTDIYVFDTGIRSTHKQFSGRVVNLALYEDVEYFAYTLKGHDHGTSVASCAAGTKFGTSPSSRIYNLNIATQAGTSRLVISMLYVLEALSDAYNEMVATGRRGVINLSFAINPTASQLELLEDLMSQIADFGGIIVAAAGNWGSNTCRWPATSTHSISVGAHDDDLVVPRWSVFGECVDVYAPGVNVKTAYPGGNTMFDWAYGTSQATGFVTGVVASYLAECEETGYWDLCHLSVIKTRLQGRKISSEISERCEESDCQGAVYQCGEKFYPREVKKCREDQFGCTEEQAGACRVYNTNRCSMCETNYFKPSNSHPCVSCKEMFGDACKHCADENGCQQCVSNDFTLTLDTASGLYYCEPSPCLNDNNNCRVCNNGLCSQCQNGYTLNHDRKSCSAN